MAYKIYFSDSVRGRVSDSSGYRPLANG